MDGHGTPRGRPGLFRYEQAGLPFDRGSVRVERLAESVTILKAMLRGEALTFAGRHYRINAQPVHPVPRRPPPVLIGGNGPRLLALAAVPQGIMHPGGRLRASG